MSITRRTLTFGAAAAGLSTWRIGGASADTIEPIRIGWLAALTGPSSAPAIGLDRGIKFAADSINEAGGIKGRKIEIVTRDTQGDPTKAVNAAQEMISRIKTHAILGPSLSGEALAATPVMARGRMPNVHGCAVETLVDPVKFPNAFRVAPSIGQWDMAASHYVLKVLKARKIAVLADTSGYGVSAVKTSTTALQREADNGAVVVYQANIDATQADVSPNLLQARDAGADAILLWSPSVGLGARMLNARGSMGWDVPVAGHAQLASGELGGLLDKKSNWRNVFSIGFRSCSYDADGKLPPRSAEFVARLKGKVELSDTLLFLVAQGFDSASLVAKAIEATGSSEGADIIKYLNTVDRYPGYFGDYSFSQVQHNGYPTPEIVMSDASSAKDGAFLIAPGYS